MFFEFLSRLELLAVAQTAFPTDRPMAFFQMITLADRHSLGVAPAGVLIEFIHAILILRSLISGGLNHCTSALTR